MVADSDEYYAWYLVHAANINSDQLCACDCMDVLCNTIWCSYMHFAILIIIGDNGHAGGRYLYLGYTFPACTKNYCSLHSLLYFWTRSTRACPAGKGHWHSYWDTHFNDKTASETFWGESVQASANTNTGNMSSSPRCTSWWPANSISQDKKMDENG